MKSRNQFATGAVIALIATGCLAAEVKEPPTRLETRAYKVPADFLLEYSTSASASVNPFGSEPRKETPECQFLTATQILKQQGIDFPAGAQALFDPRGATLTVRNTELNLDLVDMFVESMARLDHKSISFTVHLIEAPDSMLFPRDQNIDHGDDITHLSRLCGQAGKPGSSVRILHTAFLETSSGQRAMLETVADHEYTKKLAVDSLGRTAVEGRVRQLGFRLVIDPVIQADGVTARLKCLAQTVALPEQPPGPSPQFETGKVETELSIADGRTRRVGAWPVAKGVSQVVFITAHIIAEQMTRSMTSSLTALPEDALAMMEHAFVAPAELLEVKPNNKREDFNDLPVLKGLELPPGSRAGIDKLGRLHVSTTAEVMTVVDAAVQHHLNDFPKSLAFSLEVFRAPAATLRPLITESAALSDHTTALQKVKAAVAVGTATQEVLSHIETKGGRAKIHSHLDRHVLTELIWAKDHQPGLSTLHRPSGIDFEIDAAIEPGGRSVSLVFVLDRHFAHPKPWSEPLGLPSSLRRILLPRNEFPRARIRNSSRIMDGHTKLVAIWRPVSEGGTLTEDVLEASFITCRVVRHLPTDMDKGWSRRSDKAKATAPNRSEMLHRTFKVPADFVTFVFRNPKTPETPQDPFASGQLPMRDGWQDNLWKHHGISFPEGALALFNPVTSEFSVTNTEDNLILIESFVKKAWQQAAHTVTVKLHLFEAPTSELLPLVTRNRGDADHAAALKLLMEPPPPGQARRLATLETTSESGQLCTVEQVREYPFLSKITVNNSGLPDIKRTIEKVGTHFEVTPVRSTDGLTIDLTCSFTHHTAPPVPHTENLAPEGASAIDVPLTDFNVETYQGTVTMRSGTARILGVWKPTGRPEFAEKDLLHIAILEARVAPVEE